jgi:phosphoribosylamine-glycine ligase
MRFAIASGFGCALSWWMRLRAEGHEVLVWIDSKTVKHVGDGLVPKAGSFQELMTWARAKPNTVVFFDSSGLGDKAEEARRSGLPVVCGGKFMDRLEKDRAYGFKIAEEAGCKLPPYEEFNSFADCLQFVREMEELPVYFKSDRYLDSDATHGGDNKEELIEYLENLIKEYGSHGRCILQQKLDGVPLSTARWWNGMRWVGPYQFTLEHKKFLAGDLGPATGCSLNVVWYEHNPQIAEQLGWDNLTAAFQKAQAPAGLYDINSIITPSGECFFLEWTPRLGYDSEPTSQLLWQNMGTSLYNIATGGPMPEPSSALAYSVRLSIMPYPWEYSRPQDNRTCLDTYVSGEIGNLYQAPFIGYELMYKDHQVVVGSVEGIVGLVAAVGERLSSLHEKAMTAAKELRVPGLMYRNDGDKVLADDAKKLRRAGIKIPAGLLE